MGGSTHLDSFEDFHRVMVEHTEETKGSDSSEDTEDLFSALVAMGFPSDLVNAIIDERDPSEEVSLDEMVERLRELQVLPFDFSPSSSHRGDPHLPLTPSPPLMTE